VTTQYQIIYWRDIPAQLKIRAGSARLARNLSERFQEGIDEAAMKTEATGTDAYLSAWRTSEWQERDGPLEAVADALARELEDAYPSDRLSSLVQNGGYEAETSTASKA
jgi:cvfA/B/C family virulence factor